MPTPYPPLPLQVAYPKGGVGNLEGGEQLGGVRGEEELNFILPAIPIINKWNKVNKSIFPKTNCTAIVTFNRKLDSTLGLPKITKFIRDLTYLNTISLGNSNSNSFFRVTNCVNIRILRRLFKKGN